MSRAPLSIKCAEGEVMSRIEEMRQEMIKGGFYRRADIDVICSLEGGV